MAIEFKIATQAAGVGGLTLLSALATPVPTPLATHQPYQELEPLGNLTQRGTGFQSAEWTFPLLTLAQRAQLKTFCSGASAKVYIRTINQAGTYGNYLATLVWPLPEPRIRGGQLRDFVLRFEALEAAT
jgi:hypothetical protein